MSTSSNAPRTAIAFLVAPLAVPLLAALYLRTSLDDFGTGLALVFSAAVAYAGSFVLGLPIYRFLCARKLTAFWIAPVVGFIAGAAMMYATHALIALMLGGMSSVVSEIGDPRAFSDAVRLGGASGAAVGMILWLIARPDRWAK
jgi:hypothetical protein